MTNFISRNKRHLSQKKKQSVKVKPQKKPKKSKNIKGNKKTISKKMRLKGGRDNSTVPAATPAATPAAATEVAPLVPLAAPLAAVPAAALEAAEVTSEEETIKLYILNFLDTPPETKCEEYFKEYQDNSNLVPIIILILLESYMSAKTQQRAIKEQELIELIEKHIVYHLLFRICICIMPTGMSGGMHDWLKNADPRILFPIVHESLQSFKLQKVSPNSFKVTNHVFSTEEFNLNDFRFDLSNISEAITKINRIIENLKVLKTKEESYEELNTLLFNFVNDNNMYDKWKETKPTQLRPFGNVVFKVKVFINRYVGYDLCKLNINYEGENISKNTDEQFTVQYILSPENKKTTYIQRDWTQYQSLNQFQNKQAALSVKQKIIEIIDDLYQ